MNLHQFRFVREAVRQNFNLTEAAKALYTSQPGVSKAIIELEDELGVEIFTRHGKRVRSLTEPGRIILASVEKILQEVESLKRVGKDYAAQDQGNLVIAATHTQARYSLPAAIAEFKKRFPKVHLSILQGNPTQVAEMVIHDQADLAIATGTDLMVMFGKGNGTFGQPHSYPGSFTVLTVGDFNGDGFKDIAAGNMSSQVQIFFGSASGASPITM